MLYSYTAIARDGRSASGELEAGSEREVAEKLRAQDLVLLEARPPTAAVSKAGISVGKLLSVGLFSRRVSLVERMVFARNLAVMIGAGLALTRALDALERQSSNPKFRTILSAVRAGS